jgi:hypothetical protein
MTKEMCRLVDIIRQNDSICCITTIKYADLFCFLSHRDEKISAGLEFIVESRYNRGKCKCIRAAHLGELF